MNVKQLKELIAYVHDDAELVVEVTKGKYVSITPIWTVFAKKTESCCFEDTKDPDSPKVWVWDTFRGTTCK